MTHLCFPSKLGFFSALALAVLIAPANASPLLYGVYIAADPAGPGSYQTVLSPGNGLITGITSDTFTFPSNVWLVDGPYSCGSGIECTDTYISSATASGALATGEMTLGASYGSARVHMTDTLYWDISDLTQPFTVDFAVSVSGDVGGTQQIGLNTAPVEGGATLALFTEISELSQFAQGNLGYFSSGPGQNITDAEITSGSFSNAPGSTVSLGTNQIIASILIDPLSFSSDLISILLSLDVTVSGHADLTHTASVSVFSPIPYTSASGVFLTESAAAVPLPAALPLFAGGLGVMAWLARRKKRIATALA